MIVAALFMAAVPTDLLSRTDSAGLAYVQCLYGTMREAHATGLSPADFELKLANSCEEEERAHRALAARIFALRGHRAAVAEAAELDRETRRQILRDYRKLPEIERQMNEIARVCAAQPEACHQ